jgi:hypothetical protein
MDESPPAKPLDSANPEKYNAHVANWLSKLNLLKTTADDKRKAEEKSNMQSPKS